MLVKVTNMELKKYLLKRNEELEEEIEEIEEIRKFNEKEGKSTPYQVYKEQLNDNNRLLKEKC